MSRRKSETDRQIQALHEKNDRERLAFLNDYYQGFACQETDPEGSIALFTRGRDNAIRLNEPWWVIYFESLRLTAVTSYAHDFARGQPLAIELMVKLKSNTIFMGEHGDSILTDVLYTYLSIDPARYRNEIERGFEHLDQSIEPGPVSARFVMNYRRLEYLIALERWEEARELSIRSLALVDKSSEPTTRIWFGAWVLFLLCPICNALELTGELAGYAEHLGALSKKNGQLRRTEAAACFWQAVTFRAEGIDKKASRFFHQGLRLLESIELKASICAEPMARYYEVANDFVAAIGVLDRELAEITRKGMRYKSCLVHLDRCRLLVLAGLLKGEDIEAARFAISQIGDPTTFSERLERIIKVGFS